MRIVPGDFANPRLTELLRLHMARAHAETEPESAHALDVAGLQAPGISLWAAWDGDMLMGVGALKRLDAAHGEIKSMHTVEAMRGRGVGAAVLRHIIEQARTSGLTRLSLETGSQDYFRPARELYARHGFTECPPFGDYRLDPNSVFMTLEI